VTFIEAGTAAAVDMVRTAGLLRAEKRFARKVLEYARVIARSATSAARVLVVKYEVDVGEVCCSIGASVIRWKMSATSGSRKRFILVSQVWS
jgi:hypothetical protein